MAAAVTESQLWTAADKVDEVRGCGPKSPVENYHGSVVGAVYLVRDDGALLMQLRDQKADLRHAGLWVPPGGHGEGGETFEQVARREFEEETLVRCGKLLWLSAIEVELPPWPTYLLANFGGLYDNVQPYYCREGQDLRFIERERAAQLPMPAFVVDTWDRVLSRLGRDPSV